jgi:hypothetical protein
MDGERRIACDANRVGTHAAVELRQLPEPLAEDGRAAGGLQERHGAARQAPAYHQGVGRNVADGRAVGEPEQRASPIEPARPVDPALETGRSDPLSPDEYLARRFAIPAEPTRSARGDDVARPRPRQADPLDDESGRSDAGDDESRHPDGAQGPGVTTQGERSIGKPHDYCIAALRSQPESPLYALMPGMSELKTRRVVLSTQEIGESPFFPTAAIVAAAALYATLPTRFVVGSSSGFFSLARWIVPALTLMLLLVLLASVPQGPVARLLDMPAHRVRIGRRILVLTMTAIVSAANGASIVWLVHLLVNGAQTHANQLLRAGIHMWCLNVLVFALWFWELDAGGPHARLASPRRDSDFLFPQQAQPEVAGHDWRPLFLDYLYLSFTNATAFSPTDAMPLSRWAKMLMLVESTASLLLAIMVVARAVNILQ